MLDGRHHGEGKHDQRDMPMPAMPRPGFVVIEPELVLGGLEAVLDRPTAALNADERVYRSSCRAPCGEVSEISISDIAPDQQAARPQARECQKFCVEGHTVSLMAGGLYGGPEGIDRGVVGEPEP